MESLLLNPYNPSNIPIERDVLERIIGFKTNDLSIYQNAFVHKSYCKKVETQTTNSDGVAVELIECPEDCMELQEESNERLEFLGDSILGAVVTSYLYRRYDKDEGFCTKLKNKCNSLAYKISDSVGKHNPYALSYPLCVSHQQNNLVSLHKSKNKNPLCGDEMEISLIVKDNKVIDMGYQCKSCVYCQASVSLLSQNIKEKSLDEVKDFINICENIFENTKIILEKKWISFKEIFDKKNISRKECLLLPIRTVNKALND